MLTILHFVFSILHIVFSILHIVFSILHIVFSILHIVFFYFTYCVFYFTYCFFYFNVTNLSFIILRGTICGILTIMHGWVKVILETEIIIQSSFNRNLLALSLPNFLIGRTRGLKHHYILWCAASAAVKWYTFP